MTLLQSKFTIESVSEKILKIGLHLAKLQTKVQWDVFLTHSVYMFFYLFLLQYA